MIPKGPASKLTVYVDSTDKFHGKPVYEALLDLFLKKKIMGATVFRGIAGYGSSGVFHKARLFELSANLPLKIEIIESKEMIDTILPDVCHTVEKGLVMVTDANVVTHVKAE